jgi:hypothetical protein
LVGGVRAGVGFDLGGVRDGVGAEPAAGFGFPGVAWPGRRVGGWFGCGCGHIGRLGLVAVLGAGTATDRHVQIRPATSKQGARWRRIEDAVGKRSDLPPSWLMLIVPLQRGSCGVSEHQSALFCRTRHTR